MRMTTTSPAFAGSPTRMAICTPFGKAGLSFHVRASGVTRVSVSCAIAELENAIKTAAFTKSFFMLLISCPTVLFTAALHASADPEKAPPKRARHEEKVQQG